jgi:hypothetical protein
MDALLDAVLAPTRGSKRRPRKPIVPDLPKDNEPTNAELEDAFEHAVLKEERPDWAGDIDRIVATMVADGDVVLDTETNDYRLPRKRHWRFAEQEGWRI